MTLHREAHTMELAGSHTEIGRAIGQIVANIPPLKAMMTNADRALSPGDITEAQALFDRWCPGLNEELAGCAEVLGVPDTNMLFYAMTYLIPRCSNLCLLPGLTADGHTRVARSYEFSHEAEDFNLIRTAITGKHAYLGTSVLLFGRDEGINDAGLIVSMSSCGFPVGAGPFMRAPKLRGLMFWAVIRALLENCADVDEALACLEGMPIAYNLNLMLADRKGNGALYETMDGHHAYRRIGQNPTDWLLATNHIRLPELMHLEPQAMRHSKVRAETTEAWMVGRTNITEDQLKARLHTSYPEGPCCHFFSEYFGTTKSIIMDADTATLELCWGGEEANGWRRYAVNEPLAPSALPITMNDQKASPETYEFIPL